MNKHEHKTMHSKEDSRVLYDVSYVKLNSELDCDTDGDATFKEFKKAPKVEYEEIVVDTVPRKAFVFGMVAGYTAATKQLDDLCVYADMAKEDYLAHDGNEEELSTLKACVAYLRRIGEKAFDPAHASDDEHYVIQSQELLGAIDEALKHVDKCDWPWVDKD